MSAAGSPTTGSPNRRSLAPMSRTGETEHLNFPSRVPGNPDSLSSSSPSRLRRSLLPATDFFPVLPVHTRIPSIESTRSFLRLRRNGANERDGAPRYACEPRKDGSALTHPRGTVHFRTLSSSTFLAWRAAFIHLAGHPRTRSRRRDRSRDPGG